MNIATVINGKYKYNIVAPYCKLRLGWLCDIELSKEPEIIEHEYLRFWKSVDSVDTRNNEY